VASMLNPLAARQGRTSTRPVKHGFVHDVRPLVLTVLTFSTKNYGRQYSYLRLRTSPLTPSSTRRFEKPSLPLRIAATRISAARLGFRGFKPKESRTDGTRVRAIIRTQIDAQPCIDSLLAVPAERIEIVLGGMKTIEARRSLDGATDIG